MLTRPSMKWLRRFDRRLETTSMAIKIFGVTLAASSSGPLSSIIALVLTPLFFGSVDLFWVRFQKLQKALHAKA
jgi:hypothetical protein